MFPSFPHLAEAIAAERAADYQREAAAYRRARRDWRAVGGHSRLRTRSHDVVSSIARRASRTATRAA
jgi:hypothetical protein